MSQANISPTPSVTPSRLWITGHLASFYPVLVIVALVIFFGLKNPNFVTFDNVMNIGQQSSVLLLASLAGTIVILIGSIDLSIGSVITLSGIIAALTMDRAGPIGAIALGMATGMIIGLVNGATMIALKVPSFLVTLGMMSVLSGITDTICNGSSVMFSDFGLTKFLGAKLLLGLPNLIVVSLLIAAVMVFVAFKTVLGRYLFAIGGGEVVAANSGVPVTRFKIYAFIMSGALAGLAGALLAAQVGAGTPLAGSNMLLDSIAAIVMGGTALSGGVGGPQRTVLGVLVISILSNGMDVTQISSFTQEIVKGLVIILAVASTIDRKKYQFIK